ncbi:putative N-acetyltransferase YycN [Actinoplanes lobatus]|uniref:GNAT superfamily N-acetyltransferase n=1 Tax=Actinoplanes lobatus TaxID=113568 RepID=A0A7W7MJM6_9ACTN|nr:GNAT family N-acetyltransferase [Actinoplanes lobatus]MBB4752822.1 GNAT superfamily N-acetyltransferase [Actinoplanes lobatus]GGN88458.1 putative N-acetyltransferase YycN [Actinoplanes lobatus]GIE39432.1 putative N-acetyltransferase YycN [Actinoplanes lobatus]
MGALRLEPMTHEQFRSYREETVRSYAADLEGTGLTPQDALAQAEESTATLLPDGLATPGHHLWTGWDGDLEAGVLWMRIRSEADGPHAFIFDFFIHETVRRKGYGRELMRAAEARCRELGVVSIGLHVFAHNPGAHALYEQMGFRDTSYNMAKSLRP